MSLRQLELRADALLQLPESERWERVVSTLNASAGARDAPRRLTLRDNLHATVRTLRLTVPAVAWRRVGESGQPPFENGWLNYASDWMPCSFRITEHGTVRLRMMVEAGTAATVFTLPAGCRPAENLLYPAKVSGGTDARVEIYSTGAVKVQGYDATWSALGEVEFTPPIPAAPPDFAGHGWPVTVQTGLGTQVQGVTVWRVEDVSPTSGLSWGGPSVAWTRGRGDEVVLRRLSRLTPGRAYNVTLVFWGG